MLGNIFLLLSVGVIVAGITCRGYLALLASFQAVMVNVRVWLGFLLASLLLQGGITFLSVRLHTLAGIDTGRRFAFAGGTLRLVFCT